MLVAGVAISVRYKLRHGHGFSVLIQYMCVYGVVAYHVELYCFACREQSTYVGQVDENNIRYCIGQRTTGQTDGVGEISI